MDDRGLLPPSPFEVGATSLVGRAGMISNRRVDRPPPGSVLLLLDGYRDFAVIRDARASIVSDERLKGQNASRGRCEKRALAARAVFAFGPQIGKEARRFTGFRPRHRDNYDNHCKRIGA